MIITKRQYIFLVTIGTVVSHSKLIWCFSLVSVLNIPEVPDLKTSQITNNHGTTGKVEWSPSNTNISLSSRRNANGSNSDGCSHAWNAWNEEASFQDGIIEIVQVARSVARIQEWKHIVCS